jgi:hypothetical protein
MSQIQILFQDVCLLNMRKSKEERDIIHNMLLGIELPPVDEKKINIPRRSEDCYCLETTCTISMYEFRKQLSRYIDTGNLQVLSNTYDYWKKCERNDDENLISTTPEMVKYRVNMIEWFRENRWLDEENSIEWRREHAKGPINLPEVILKNARAELYKEALEVFSRNPEHIMAEKIMKKFQQ